MTHYHKNRQHTYNIHRETIITIQYTQKKPHFKSQHTTQTFSIQFPDQQAPQHALKPTDYYAKVNTIIYIIQENGYDPHLTETLINTC